MSPAAFQRLGVLILLLAIAGGFGEWAREGVLLATGAAGLLILVGAAIAQGMSDDSKEMERWIRGDHE